MFRLWCLLIGYVCGLIPTAYIVGKVKGIDIREHGSGNAGTTNALRVMGKRAGGIVLAGDMLKCFLGIAITYFVFRKFYPDQIFLIRIYTALGIILGHDYPFFLHFKGGKGIACFGGMVLSFYAPVIPACIITFFGTFFLTHLVSLSSIMLLFTFFAEAIIFGQAGFLKMSQGNLYELYGVILVLVILALFQHRKNIVRLIKGEERRTYLKKKSEENISAELRNKKEKEKNEKNKTEKSKTEKSKNASSAEKKRAPMVKKAKDADGKEEAEIKPRIKEVIDPKNLKNKPAVKKDGEKKQAGPGPDAPQNGAEETDPDDLELEDIMESIKEGKPLKKEEKMDYIELDESPVSKESEEKGKAEGKEKVDPDAENMEIPDFLKKDNRKSGKKKGKK